MHKAFLLRFRLVFCLLLIFFRFQVAAQTRFPSFLQAEKANQLTSEWLVFDQAERKFIPYIPEEHEHIRAFHQKLTIRSDYPFEISFPADKGLCLFLNNQLLFKADSASDYTLDLTGLILLRNSQKVLLTVWTPDHIPAIGAFSSNSAEVSAESKVTPKNNPALKLRPPGNKNAFILFLLVIGLIYGILRTSFPSDFYGVSRLGNIFNRSAQEEGFLGKPVASWPAIFFVLAFALGFSVLVVAIKVSGLNAFLFNRFSYFSNADIMVKILFNAGIVFGVIMARYLFLNFIAYIFSLTEVVGLQYREFLRGTLFIGFFLPVIILLYLVFYQGHPQVVTRLAGVLLAMLLTVIVLRVIYLLNKKESLFNLHLFSYICATEIIPLTVVLKLILFNS